VEHVNEDRAADFLAQEYLFLEKAVEDFDARALTIKAWSVTFSAAGLGLAYQQDNPLLLLIASGSALVFWLIEAVWKYHQRAFYPRIIEIETWFASHAIDRDSAPFQIMIRWGPELHRSSMRPRRKPYGGPVRRLAIPLFVGVMLPHVVVFVVGVLLYWWAPPGGPTARAAPVVATAPAR
jgi:hypothetical protein